MNSEPLHVIHIIESLGPAGAERLLYLYLKHLDARRIRSTVITLLRREDVWADPIRRLGVEVECLNYSSYRDLPRATWSITARLRRLRPNLVHTHLWLANVAGRTAAKICGIPVMSTIHSSGYDTMVLQDNLRVAPWKPLAARYLDRLTARSCERLIAVSRYVRYLAHRQLEFPLDRIEVIHNPIDVDRIVRASSARQELLQELNLSPESQILLHVGRVMPQKGLINAIQALPRVRAQFPQAHLVSLGDANVTWQQHLRQEVERLGLGDAVHWLGARSNVGALLKAADIFVFPSIVEGLGLALIEAMAAGCPCVASGIEPVREIVGDGENVYLVPPNHSERLAEALLRLLGDPAEMARLGQAAQKAVLTRFRPEPAAARLLELYETIACR